MRDIRNPYRNRPELARVWDVMFAGAMTGCDGLFYPDGSDRRGGSHTCAFWDGFNGCVKAVSRGPSGSISSACFRAGADFRRWVDSFKPRAPRSRCAA